MKADPGSVLAVTVDNDMLDLTLKTFKFDRIRNKDDDQAKDDYLQIKGRWKELIDEEQGRTGGKITRERKQELLNGEGDLFKIDVCNDVDCNYLIEDDKKNLFESQNPHHANLFEWIQEGDVLEDKSDWDDPSASNYGTAYDFFKIDRIYGVNEWKNLAAAFYKEGYAIVGTRGDSKKLIVKGKDLKYLLYNWLEEIIILTITEGFAGKRIMIDIHLPPTLNIPL